MTFSCMVDAEKFKNLISMPTALIEETDITLGTTGIKISSMDPSHVALVRVELSKSMFEEYVCDKDTKVRLSIRSGNGTGNGNGYTLVGQWPKKTKDSFVTLTLDEDTKKLGLKFNGKLRKECKIPLLEAGDEEPPNPKLYFTAKIRIILADLLDIFTDLQRHSDNFRINAETFEQLRFEAVTELSTQEYPIERGNDRMLEYELREPSKATYNTNYMIPILKQLATAFEIVTLEWSTNMPMKISGDNTVQGATVEYFLAPRVESDDTAPQPKPEPTLEEPKRKRNNTVISSDIVEVPYVNATS